MKKTWDVKDFEIIPMRIPTEEYNQLLDETAELVYRYFCQLCEIKNLAPVTDTVNQTHEKRTGTDA